MVADQHLPEGLIVDNMLAEAAAHLSEREEQEQLDQKQGPDAAGKWGAAGGARKTGLAAVRGQVQPPHREARAATGSATVWHSSAVRSVKAKRESISSSKSSVVLLLCYAQHEDRSTFLTLLDTPPATKSPSLFCVRSSNPYVHKQVTHGNEVWRGNKRGVLF